MGKSGLEESATHASSGRADEILDAATELFAERGFHDADTQGLCERLGIGKGTIYRCFSSKRELFLAAVDRVMRRMQAELEASTAGLDDPLERLAATIRAYLEFFVAHPRYVELLIQERALFRDREKPTYFAYRDRNKARWTEVYRALIAEGRLRDMPVEQISDVISNLVYGTMFTNHFTGQPKSSDLQAKEILDVIDFGILSESERRRHAEKCRPAS